jgi:hypothetical protein
LAFFAPVSFMAFAAQSTRRRRLGATTGAFAGALAVVFFVAFLVAAFFAPAGGVTSASRSSASKSPA